MFSRSETLEALRAQTAAAGLRQGIKPRRGGRENSANNYASVPPRRPVDQYDTDMETAPLSSAATANNAAQRHR